MSIHLLAGGRAFRLTLSTAEAAELLDVSEDTARRRCVDGLLPLMPKTAEGPWRIPTIRLLEWLGVAYELDASADTSSRPVHDAPTPPSVATASISRGRGGPGDLTLPRRSSR